MVRTLAGAALALLAAGPATVRGSDVADPGRQVRQVQEALDARQYGIALDEARRAVASMPSSPAALHALARAAEAAGEFDEARAAWQRARAVAPEDIDLMFGLASLAAKLGEFAEAGHLLDLMAGAQPWLAREAFLRGDAEHKRAAIRERPLLRRLVQLRIDLLMGRGDLDGARRLAREHALFDASTDFCGEAQRLMKTHDADALLQALRAATLTQPDHPQCVWWYGVALSDLGYVHLPRVLVLEAARGMKRPYRASGHEYVRIRLSGDGDVPWRAELLSLTGRQRYVRDADAGSAARLLEQAIRLAPRFARPYNHLARIAWDRGDRETAVATLEQALLADPESWRTRRNLGKALAEMGRLPEAERHLRRSLEQFEDDVGAKLALARVLYARRKFDGYVAQTREALTMARAWSWPLPGVEEFLIVYQQSGPDETLPPAPDQRSFIGFGED